MKEARHSQWKGAASSLLQGVKCQSMVASNLQSFKFIILRRIKYAI
jgi:hypothetical protein